MSSFHPGGANAAMMDGSARSTAAKVRRYESVKTITPLQKQVGTQRRKTESATRPKKSPAPS
ncbi:MAG: hypothetical protein J6S40_01625 [Thermoguttaceae bacterium]|nr:hypothetical protein [Thermoguttaceae bacterium]